MVPVSGDTIYLNIYIPFVWIINLMANRGRSGAILDHSGTLLDYASTFLDYSSPVVHHPYHARGAIYRAIYQSISTPLADVQPRESVLSKPGYKVPVKLSI